MPSNSIPVLALALFAATAAAQPATFYVYAEDSFESGRARSGARSWADATTALRIEWQPAKSDKPVEVIEAIAGGERWPFTFDRKRGRATLVVTEAVREAWVKHGALAIRAGGGPVVRIRARPRSLQLERPVEFTVQQRETVKVPGSREWLEVSLDDITAGQVRLGLRTVEGGSVVPARSVRDGTALGFRVGEEDYTLRVQRLVNVLIGEDFATLRLSRGRVDPVEAEIDRLLAHVARSGVTFVREGRRHTGGAAADHLRRKYRAAGDTVKTVDDFIDKVASKSSMTGKDYLVETPDGETVKAQTWLRARVREFQRENGKGQ